MTDVQGMSPEDAERFARDLAMPMLRDLAARLDQRPDDRADEGELLALVEELTTTREPVYLAAVVAQILPVLPGETRGQYAARLLQGDSNA